MSFDSQQNVTLFDDPSIHEKYNIPEHYSAVLDPLGHLRTMYRGDEVVPKFANTVTKVISEHVKTMIPGK